MHYLLAYSEGGDDIANGWFGFIFAPVSLNHVVTFNVIDILYHGIQSPFTIACRLYDNERRQSIQVVIQNGKH